MTRDDKQLTSEQIIIEAPLSFTGSAKRISRRVNSFWLRPICIFLTWLIVLCWYLSFGLLLVPYRLIRRSMRKQRRDMLRHRELIAK